MDQSFLERRPVPRALMHCWLLTIGREAPQISARSRVIAGLNRHELRENGRFKS
jgi:hypothetical protein